MNQSICGSGMSWAQLNFKKLHLHVDITPNNYYVRLCLRGYVKTNRIVGKVLWTSSYTGWLKNVSYRDSLEYDYTICDMYLCGITLPIKNNQPGNHG